MPELQRSEVLCVPKRRRLIQSTVKGEAGQDVLHVFYGEKELIFDEPELLPFGSKLLEVDRFPAEQAMSWSNGAPHEWEKVRELLEALLAEEILKRVNDSAATTPEVRTWPATLGTPPADPEPRTFSAHDDRCPTISKQVFGRALELSNLEVVVPVYRVAHPSLDQDGRQVGENNVQPRVLFLDLPTQRRVCNYAGNRYQADVPMNVTALRHMTSRWPELLSLTEQSRAAFLARVPSRGPSLLAGEAHLLTVCTLASVGYVMVRGVQPIPNGELDPGLAAMFRLIDGVRLVTTEMMRETAGRHGCERPVTGQSVADYAERYAVYYGTHGVCAGPQALIEEYLSVLLDGAKAPIQVEPGLASRLGDGEAALDYGLRGQRIESIVRVFGAMQGLLHERLRLAFQRHAEPRTRLHEALEQPIDAAHYALVRENHPLAETLELEIQVSRWLFDRASEWLPREEERTSVEERLTLDSSAQESGRRELSAFLVRSLPYQSSLSEPLRHELAAVAVDAFALERRCLRSVVGEQLRLNARLQRASAGPVTGDDIALYTRPRSGPPMAATLAALGLSVTTDALATRISSGSHSLSLTS